MNKPLVGLTSLYCSDIQAFCTRTTYVEAVIKAGGNAVLLPSIGELESVPQLVAHLNGLLLPGGPDVSPLMYGEEPIPQVTSTRRKEDLFEMSLVRACLSRDIPIFAICRGCQLLNVALGGTLYQDLSTQKKNAICHAQAQTHRDECTHSIKILPETYLENIIGQNELLVNSFHHQAIRKLGHGLTVSAQAADGVIEAVESKNGRILAVQWHPEDLVQLPGFFALFTQFIKLCTIKGEGN